MSVQNKILPITLASLESAEVSDVYTAINDGGFAHPVIICWIDNQSTEDITISYDGINPHDYIPASSEREINIQSNKGNPNYIAAFAKGTTIYAMGTAGTGNIYISGFYQPLGN